MEIKDPKAFVRMIGFFLGIGLIVLALVFNHYLVIRKNEKTSAFGPGNRIMESATFETVGLAGWRFVSGPHPIEGTGLAYIEIGTVEDPFPVLVAGSYKPPEVNEPVELVHVLIHRSMNRIQLITPRTEKKDS